LTVENVEWQEKSRDELKQQSPTATFPFLTTPQGVLSQSSAIVEYLAQSHNTALLGTDAFTKAQVKQWVELAINELRYFAKSIVYPLFGWAEYDKDAADKAQKGVKELLKVLEKHIQGKDFFVGSQVSLADLYLFAGLRSFFQFVYVEDVRKNLFPQLTQWFVRLANESQAIKAFGRTLLCKTPLKPTKVEKKKEAKKEEKKEAKKEEKKEVKKEKKEGEEEEEEKPKKKKQNPLDILPPSSFVLDDFKREFLNSKDKPGVLKEFWNKIDLNGYSFWFMQYQKLASEGKILFKSNNSSSFFLQKLDSFRKYSFSVHGVYGEEGNYEIRGVWMWRGVEIPEEVKSHDSFPYMTIKQLDPKSESDRQLIETYWLNL
jgi:elongation factor 1-gamma